MPLMVHLEFLFCTLSSSFLVTNDSLFRFLLRKFVFSTYTSQLTFLLEFLFSAYTFSLSVNHYFYLKFLC